MSDTDTSGERRLLQAQIEAENGSALAGIIVELQQASKRILARLDEHDAAIETLQNAFPGKDSGAHCRYHQLLIEEMTERKKIRSAVLEQVIKGSVWALLVAAGTGLFTFAKEHFKW
jgi:hypothetical protein